MLQKQHIVYTINTKDWQACNVFIALVEEFSEVDTKKPIFNCKWVLRKSVLVHQT